MSDAGTGTDVTALHADRLTSDSHTMTGRPVVLLHGFTQNTRCWGPFGDALAGKHLTFAVDAPGHGGSTDVHADLPTTATLVADVIDRNVDGPAIIVGYSMGGRTALHLALARPDLVEALVLIGATGGLSGQADREARRAADDALADHVLAVGVRAFLEEWLAQPLFASLSSAAACRTERLANTAEGLASSLRLAGTGTQEPLWDRLGTLPMPVLVIAGEYDAKFQALGNRLVDAIGVDARLEVIPGAGHAAHLERPVETAAVIEAWRASQTS